MTRIPVDPIGYKVDADGMIHTRYATHAAGQRTRTEKGVKTLLNGDEGSACVECYGKTPRYPDTTPRPPQKRRISTVSVDAAKRSQKNGDGR